MRQPPVSGSPPRARDVALTSPSTTREVAVSLDGVSKRFPIRRGWRDVLRAPLRKPAFLSALHGITFDVAAGECFGVLGPNGAGKTTLFRIIAGAMPPDAGTTHVGGIDLTSNRAVRAARGLVTSVMANDRTLYWRLSGYENLRLYASLHGMSGRIAPQRVDAVLDIVGLRSARDRMVAELSTGMKQRLLIARALIPQPRILLLDEPTRSLDPIAAQEFRDFIKRNVLGSSHCTVLVATHSDEEAFALCDRVAFLDRGRLAALGTLQDVAQRLAECTYELTTRSPQHGVFEWLATQGKVTSLRFLATDSAGWTRLTMVIAGGADAAAEVLNIVTAAGVRVAEFTAVAATLAEIMHRVRRTADAEPSC
jgi:ABC-2 type transport system ATP-binding protein